MRKILLYFVFLSLLIKSFFSEMSGELDIKRTGCACGLEITEKDPGEKARPFQYRVISEKFVEPPQRYPWVVFIRIDGAEGCGGTIISPTYILSAGHCASAIERSWNNKGTLPAVCIATKDIENENLPTIINKVIYHPKFKEKEDYAIYDIALLQLLDVMYYSERVSPICFPKRNEYDRTKEAIAVGWGKQEDKASGGSRFLKEAKLPIISDEECAKRLPNGTAATYYHNICAAGETKDQDICEGDSGGPLQKRSKKGRWYIIGLVSWGVSCGKGRPGVFSRFSFFKEWINENLKVAPQCTDLIKPKVGYNWDDCGMPSLRTTNETNGTYTVLKWPWMARIYLKEEFLGTGVLINRSMILTTSDVVSRRLSKKKDWPQLKLMLGRSRKNAMKSMVLQTVVDRVLFYPSNRSRTVPVLLRLKLKMKYDTLHYHPICFLTSKLEAGSKVFTTVFVEKKRFQLIKTCGEIIADKENGRNFKDVKNTICVKSYAEPSGNKQEDKAAILQYEDSSGVYLLGLSICNPPQSGKKKRFILLQPYEKWIRNNTINADNKHYEDPKLNETDFQEDIGGKVVT